jgi:hypothetical protein
MALKVHSWVSELERILAIAIMTLYDEPRK